VYCPRVQDRFKDAAMGTRQLRRAEWRRRVHELLSQPVIQVPPPLQLIQPVGRLAFYLNLYEQQKQAIDGRTPDSNQNDGANPEDCL
jgi:hypothetical protein